MTNMLICRSVLRASSKASNHNCVAESVIIQSLNSNYICQQLLDTHGFPIDSTGLAHSPSTCSVGWLTMLRRSMGDLRSELVKARLNCESLRDALGTILAGGIPTTLEYSQLQPRMRAALDFIQDGSTVQANVLIPERL